MKPRELAVHKALGHTWYYATDFAGITPRETNFHRVCPYCKMWESRNYENTPWYKPHEKKGLWIKGLIDKARIAEGEVQRLVANAQGQSQAGGTEKTI